jgi:hypothetical protein
MVARSISPPPPRPMPVMPSVVAISTTANVTCV